MIGIVARITQCRLGILLDLNGSRRSKQGTDIDGHIEDGETGVALVGILRIIVEITYHHLEISLEETRTETDQQQGCQHHHKGHRVTTQGH